MDILQFLQQEPNIDRLRQEAIKFTLYTHNLITNMQSQNKLNEFIVNNVDLSCEFPKCDNPKISVIIPVKNQVHLTKIVLNSIYKNTEDIPYEVIIANDKSDDETNNLDKTFKNIRIIDNPKRPGFVYNVRNAIRNAYGEYIFLMNNDMIACKNYLSELLKVIEEDSTIGIAGSKNLNIDGTILECGIKINSSAKFSFLYQNQPEDTKDEEKYIECDYCSGCSILFKKSVWEKAGGFDKKYAPAYYEDSDFAFNLKYNFGLKSVCVPRSKIYHFKGKSYETNSKYNSHDNRNYFLKKWENVLEQFD